MQASKYLLSDDLAVVPFAIEKVTIIIYCIPDSNMAIDMQWPPEIIFYIGHLDWKDLQNSLAAGIIWDNSLRIAHGTQWRYKKVTENQYMISDTLTVICLFIKQIVNINRAILHLFFLGRPLLCIDLPVSRKKKEPGELYGVR